MRAIPILPLTGAMVVSTTAAEPGPGETAWASGTTYAIGDEVARSSTHQVYVRRTAGAGTTAPELDPVNWRPDRPTNAWAMFTAERNTQTVVNASTLTVVIAPGKRINAICLTGLDADSARVVMVVGGATVYDSGDMNLILRRSRNATDYAFGGFRYQPSSIKFDLPPYAQAVITVTFTTSRSTLKVGGVHVGWSHYIGRVLAGAQSGLLSFSKVERGAFGEAQLVRRRTVPKTQQTVFFDKGLAPSLIDLRRDTDSLPTIWSGLDDAAHNDYFEALLIVGIYRAWDIDLTSYRYGQSSLQLEEI